MPWVLGALLAVVGGVLGLSLLYPGALASQDAQIQLAYGLALVTLLIGSLLVMPRLRVKETAKAALTWAAVFLALLTVYRYQDGFKKLGSEMLYTVDASAPESTGDGIERLRASSGGHFLATAEVNGKRVRFLVDTGATTVALTREDARRAGLKVDDLDYVVQVQTANGMTTMAPVRLKSIRIGSIEVKNVQASVARDGLEGSLLGMSFLRRLSGVEFKPNELVLKQ
jgi:aspartyl protease family protein